MGMMASRWPLVEGSPMCAMDSVEGCLAVTFRVSPGMGEDPNGHDNQDRTVHV